MLALLLASPLALAPEPADVPDAVGALEPQQLQGPVEPLQPALIVLAERYDTRQLVLEGRALPRRERRQFVLDRLVPFAEASQANAVEQLERWAAAGHVGRVRSLWNVNALRAELSSAAAQALEALPSVERVTWDPELPAEAIEDSAPAGGLQFTQLPAQTGFEGGLPSWVQLGNSGAATAAWTTEHQPSEGANHVVLSGDGSASLAFGVNLGDVAGARLEFTARTLGDVQDSTGFYVIGPSGQAVQLLSFADGKEVQRYSVDLGAVTKSAGVQLGADMQFGFIWTGGPSAPTSGLAIDEVRVTADTAPSYSATVNVWKIGAPRAWELGYDGGSSLLLILDSGLRADHPGLVNRMWSNPGEIPGNGIDDDGNGYVDDVQGWNFSSNSNEFGTASHGTNCAGIAVGDGGQNGGLITGVAPGATLAFGQIGSEGAALEAYQYGIAIGADALTASVSFKLISNPNYGLFREAMEVELAAGLIHANSIGNQGNLGTSPSYEIPYNVSTPGNCPGPWIHPEQVVGGLGSVLGVAGVTTGSDQLYTDSGHGPAAWEDVKLTKPGYPKAQDPADWDYPYAGGASPGLLKPDLAAYTFVTTLSGSAGTTPSFGGTSAATPHVGGCLAVLLDANPALLPRQISQALQETAWDLGPAGKDIRYGAGRVDLEAALLRLLGTVTAFPQDPLPGDDVELHVAGPAGDAWALFFSETRSDVVLPGGLYLRLGAPQLYTLGLHTGGDAPTELSATLPSDLVSGTEIHLQLATVGLAGPLQDRLLTSVVETLTIQ